jgi:hypothetical protein
MAFTALRKKSKLNSSELKPQLVAEHFMSELKLRPPVPSTFLRKLESHALTKNMRCHTNSTEHGETAVQLKNEGDILDQYGILSGLLTHARNAARPSSRII